MNKSVIALRVACVFIFIHLAGHFFGHTEWETPLDPKIQEVVNSMIVNKAEFMGVDRSMADFYNGYSYILFGVYILSIWVLWVLSMGIKKGSGTSKRAVLPFGIIFLAFGAIEFIYFFPFAAIISSLAGLLILYSFFTAKKRR